MIRVFDRILDNHAEIPAAEFNIDDIFKYCLIQVVC